MIKLVCRDYGFECDFVAEGTMVSEVMELFAKHTSEEHGIRHSKDKIQFMLRNRSKNNMSKNDVENFVNKANAERNRLEKWKIGRGNFP
jgi:predicted small metal-binding protein